LLASRPIAATVGQAGSVLLVGGRAFVAVATRKKVLGWVVSAAGGRGCRAVVRSVGSRHVAVGGQWGRGAAAPVAGARGAVLLSRGGGAVPGTPRWIESSNGPRLRLSQYKCLDTVALVLACPSYPSVETVHIYTISPSNSGLLNAPHDIQKKRRSMTEAYKSTAPAPLGSAAGAIAGKTFDGEERGRDSRMPWQWPWAGKHTGRQAKSLQRRFLQCLCICPGSAAQS